MGLIIDGTTIPTSGTVYVDGVAMQKVYIDGTLVWTKAAESVTWDLGWSGQVYIEPFVDYGPNFGSEPDPAYPEDFGEAGEMTLTYTSGWTLGSTVYNALSNGLVQADADLMVDIYDQYGHQRARMSQDTITANTSSSTTKGNLPWNPENSLVGSTLYGPVHVGSGRIDQSAITGWSWNQDNYTYDFEYFDIRNIYYGH